MAALSCGNALEASLRRCAVQIHVWFTQLLY